MIHFYFKKADLDFNKQHARTETHCLYVNL